MSVLLISACISMLVFSFLFYKLNNSELRLFNSVQIKINTLSEKKKHKVKITSYILIFIIMFILPIFNNSDIIAGLIIGLLLAFREICFSENVIENN